jgi:hypothetical protein
MELPEHAVSMYMVYPIPEYSTSDNTQVQDTVDQKETQEILDKSEMDGAYSFGPRGYIWLRFVGSLECPLQ